MIRAYPRRATAVFALLTIALIWLLREPIYDAYISFLGWIYSEQKAFHKVLVQNISSYADRAGISTGFAIVAGSFLYGVFHAAGPGHGKVILSTYLLSQPEKVTKSVTLAVVSSLVQGIVAIVLVYGLFYVFGLVSRDMKWAVAWSERLAFGLVIALGLVLVWRSMKGAGFFRRPKLDLHDHGHAHDHEHSHHHHHSDDHPHHRDEHGVCSTCGHAHVPSAEQVDKAADLRTALGIIFSIGMRPCTGAVLVLVFARFAGIPWAGVMAVVAMSMGTAITVTALAVLSVKMRDTAMNILGMSSGLAERASLMVAFAGGVILIAMGYGLLSASFDAPMRSMGL